MLPLLLADISISTGGVAIAAIVALGGLIEFVRRESKRDGKIDGMLEHLQAMRTESTQRHENLAKKVDSIETGLAIVKTQLDERTQRGGTNGAGNTAKLAAIRLVDDGE